MTRTSDRVSAIPEADVAPALAGHGLAAAAHVGNRRETAPLELGHVKPMSPQVHCRSRWM